MFKKFKKLLRTVLEKIGLIDKPEMGVVEPPVIPPVADPVKKLLDENKGVSYDLDKILGRQETKDNPFSHIELPDIKLKKISHELSTEEKYRKELENVERALARPEYAMGVGHYVPGEQRRANEARKEYLMKQLAAIDILKKYQTEDCAYLDENSEGCLFRALRKEPIKYEEVEAALKLSNANALNADGQTALDLLPKIPVTDSEKRLARLMNKYGAKRSLEMDDNKTDTNETGELDINKLLEDLRKSNPHLFDPKPIIDPTPNPFDPKPEPDPHPFDPNPIPMPNPVPMPKPYPYGPKPELDPLEPVGPGGIDPSLRKRKPKPKLNPFEPIGPGGIDPKWKVIDGLPEPKPDAYKKLKDHMKQKYGLDFEGDLISPAKDKDVTATLLATKGSRE